MRLTLWPKRLLFLAYAVAAIMVVLQLGLSRVPAALVVVLPLAAIEGLLRLLAGPRLKVFTQQVHRLMQEGADEKLLAYYDQQRFLQFAGPSYVLLDKLGLIHAHLGNAAAAAAAYQDALDEAPGKKQVEIAIKLADALRLSGEHEKAERFYREVVAVTDEHAQTNQHLAELLLARDPTSDEALELLRKADQHARRDAEGAILRCNLVRLLLDRGEPDEAKRVLEQARRDLEGSDNLVAQELFEQAQAALTAHESAAVASKEPAITLDAR